MGVLELEGGGLGEVVGGGICYDLYDFLVLGAEERGDGLGKAFWLTRRQLRELELVLGFY